MYRNFAILEGKGALDILVVVFSVLQLDTSPTFQDPYVETGPSKFIIVEIYFSELT